MVSEREIYVTEIDKVGRYVRGLLKVNTPNSVTDCCVTLASDGKNVVAAWLRETENHKWHVYLKKIKGEVGTEVGIATEIDTDASNLSMIYHKGSLVVSWEEEGVIKVTQYDGTVRIPNIVVNSEVARRPSLVTVGDNILVGWDSSIGIDEEPQQILGMMLDSSGFSIDQGFSIDNDKGSNKKCCLHFTKNNEANILATWLSYNKENSYIIVGQAFDNDATKLGDAFVISDSTMHHPTMPYQAEKVNIKSSVINDLGMKVTILENSAYFNSQISSLNLFLYYTTAGRLEADISAPRKVRKNQLVRIQPMQSLTNSIEATIALQEVTSVMKPIGATY